MINYVSEGAWLKIRGQEKPDRGGGGGDVIGEDRGGVEVETPVTKV